MDRPTVAQLNAEIERERRARLHSRSLGHGFWILIVVAAVSFLFASFFVSVIQVSGHSMENTCSDGDILIVLRKAKIKDSDIAAFYYNNRILLKRVIATEGETVDIDDTGTVTVNGQNFGEPYVINKSKKDCDIELPVQVPAARYFFLGDNRRISVDSRSSKIGCVEKEDVMGKIVFRIWPLQKFGIVY